VLLFDGAVAQVERDGHVRIGDLHKLVLRAFEGVARQITGGETSLRFAIRTYATAPEFSLLRMTAAT